MRDALDPMIHFRPEGDKQDRHSLSFKPVLIKDFYLKGDCHLVSRFLRFWALLVVLLTSGCTSYYRITDQSTRRVYFATGYDRISSGAVQFYDESRADVTLQSSEIVEISGDEFDSGLKQ